MAEPLQLLGDFMIVPLGRFVLRSPDDGGSEPDGLLLGALFKSQSLLKANRVYECGKARSGASSSRAREVEMDRRLRPIVAWYEDFEEASMTATVLDEDENAVTVHCAFVVCPTCDGKGSYVNPSIDAGGLTEEDRLDWTPEDEEDYFSGAFDVECASCQGKRVVPSPVEWTDPAILALLASREEDARQYAEECAAERRNGA